ncbi:MAG: DUF1573 domain-containing protein [Marinifilaceae bacterium]
MMRRILFMLLLLIPSALFSQKKNVSIMDFKEEVADFGTINENGGPVSQSFTFTNTGDKPLIIKNVRVSCGCTTPDWSKKPIPPGESGEIKVTFDPKNRPGKFMKSVTVTSTATKPIITLTIKGNVIRKVVEEKPQEQAKAE